MRLMKLISRRISFLNIGHDCLRATSRANRRLGPIIKNLILGVMVACSWIYQSVLADEFPGIESLMSEEDFQATGLDQLTPAQLQALDRWLLNYTGGAGQILQSNKAVKTASKDFEITSRLSGSFTGWSGDTVFLLENGQRWRQRLSGRYFYQGEPNPAVKISRNFFGYYMMTLIDEDRAVGVSPIE